MIKFDDLLNRIEKCHKCDARKCSKSPVKPRGNAHNPLVMFVGMNPGKNEDEQGMPFVGKAGTVLYGAIRYIGLKEQEYYITNMVKCRTPGNRAPNASETIACGEYIKEEILYVKPRLIVFLGCFVARSMGYLVEITKVSGKSFLDKYQYFYMLHPASTFRQQRYREIWDKSVQELGKVVETLRKTKTIEDFV